MSAPTPDPTTPETGDPQEPQETGDTPDADGQPATLPTAEEEGPAETAGSAQTTEPEPAGEPDADETSAEPEPEPFADGPPPLPTPMLVLDGTLPDDAGDQQSGPGPADHGTCATCGGAYDEDGWCTQCGERKPDPRHHFTARPAPHVAGVCDRGRRHTDNEDAMAVRADPDRPGRAVLVVCDGVTMSTRSAEASLAASEAAVEVLDRGGAPATTRVVQAADAAATAVDQVAEQFPGSSPSCTLVAGVVEDGTLTVGNVGDSRGYWLPDEGEPLLLTRDDSMAEEQVAAGMARADAEAGPLAHTITRWLGPDAPDHTPRISTQDVTGPGWVLLCTDGLWNYASEAADLQAVVRAEQERAGDDPLDLGLALVAWANAQGGADNITIALARTGSAGQDGAHG